MFDFLFYFILFQIALKLVHIGSLADACPPLCFFCSAFGKKKHKSHNVRHSKPFALFIHVNLHFVTHTHGLCWDKCTFTSLVGKSVLDIELFSLPSNWRKWGVCFPHLYYSFILLIFFAIFIYFVYIVEATQLQVRLCLLVLQAIVVSRKHEIRERPCFTVTSESKRRRA